jgi:hypothetical protein
VKNILKVAWAPFPLKETCGSWNAALCDIGGCRTDSLSTHQDSPFWALQLHDGIQSFQVSWPVLRSDGPSGLASTSWQWHECSVSGSEKEVIKHGREGLRLTLKRACEALVCHSQNSRSLENP